MADRNTSIRRSQLKPIIWDDLDATNSPSDNYVPSYDDVTKKFTWIAIAGGVSVLNDLTDVDFDTGTPADNNVLTYDSGSGKWKAEAPQGGLTELSEDITPQLGGDLDLNGKNIDFPSVVNISDVKDEDDMTSDSATMLATQQSIKAYVDNSVPNLSTSVDDFTIKYENSKLKIADRIEQNIALLAFYRAIDQSKSIYNLVDGFVDEYEDETGIDTVNSINEDYDSDNDLYQPISIADLELDYMEYSTDELARASWVSSDPDVAGSGVDDDTKLLLHCNGADESTTFTDASPSAHGNATVAGTAKVDTTNKKFGTGSLELDGNSDYLEFPDSADWDICANNSDTWTIDFWAKHTDHVGSETYIGQSTYWRIEHVHGNGLQFLTAVGFSIATGYGGEITDTDWHHIVLVIKGTGSTKDIGMYKDGIQVNYTQDADIGTLSGVLRIGANHSPGDFLDGHIDEIRIQKSNPFEASPDAGLTDTITVPTGEYSGAVSGSLNIYSEGGTGAIVNQGSYSLKAIAEAVNSLNQTITNTLGTGNELDLTNYNSIKLDVYASEVGTNLQIQIHDSGGTTSTKDIIIETGEENDWKTITWDISGISSANKDDIDSIIIKVISSDTGTNDNTFYIDNVYAVGLTQNMILISNSVSAESEPDTIRIVAFEEDVDAISENTDAKFYASRDGGSTWAEITVQDEGNYSGTKRVLSGLADLTVTGIGSGTDICYKISSHNNKDLKIHGVACSWS